MDDSLLSDGCARRLKWMIAHSDGCARRFKWMIAHCLMGVVAG